MKHTFTTILIFGILGFTSCHQKGNKEIPEGAFPISYKGHLYIKGSINDIEGNYVFDTGASNLYIDHTHYSNNNFQYKNTSLGILPGAGTKPQRVTVIQDTVQFNFGNNVYKTTGVPVLELKSILGDIADGIIGMNYFNNAVLEVSYESEYMKIYPNMDALDIQGWDKIALSKNDNRLYIPLSVNVNDSITISGDYLLDFGSGGSVSLTSIVSKEYKLERNIDKKVPYFTKYAGVAGESSSYNFITSSLSIGSFEFNKVPMDFSLDKKGAFASEKYLGIVGNKIFERFHVVIDFRDNNLYLKPNRKYHNLFKPSRLGFSYVDRGQSFKHWVVTGLFSSLNADKAGLEIDDKILAINEVEVSELNYERQKSFFDDIDKVFLKVERNGKMIEINFNLQAIITEAK